MAKNKVYLTVLLALLAGFAVLTGCVGEGADDASKSAGVSGNPAGEIPGDLPGEGETGGGDPPGGGTETENPPGEGETEEREIPVLDPETELQMKLDCLKYFDSEGVVTVHNISFDYYYGSHNGYEIIVFLGGMDAVGWVTIAGYGFGFESRPVNMLAWKQGEDSESFVFYRVEEAYDSGLFTEDDIRGIYELYIRIGSNKYNKP